MNELAVFAKYWQPGRVKTRLAASLGAEVTSEIYRQFVLTLLSRLECCGDRRCLVYSPHWAAPTFQQLVAARRLCCRPQIQGDLGARMDHDVQQSLRSGVQAVVIVGSDSPSLPVAYVDEAFEHLQRHDVVLGPTEDGGYYLIGVRQHLPGLFAHIDWSTIRVWQQTLDRLDRMPSRPTYAVLPYWYDVDTLPDLHRLVRDTTPLLATDAFLAKLHSHLRHALEG